MIYDASSPGPSGGGGSSPFRKLAVKPKAPTKPGPVTVITARRTCYPPNSPHGSGMTANVQIGVRLRAGIANPRLVMQDAWSTSSLREAIRSAEPHARAHLLHTLTNIVLAPRLWQLGESRELHFLQGAGE